MANFDKVSNYVNQGLQTAQQAVQLVQNLKSAKSGTATTAQTATTTAATPTTATGATTTTAQRQTSGSTSLTLGINKKSLMIGGAILAGIIVVALVARR